MSLNIAVVVGNPKPKSRTLDVACALVEALFGDDAAHANVVDLADHSADVLAWPAETMDATNAAVAASDVVVFASPTYKATYTGLLKCFLDRYPANGLRGVTAIPLLTGASPAHSMGSTFTLAPLLVELGAIVPGRGFYFEMSHMERIGDVVREAADEYAHNIGRLANVATGVSRPREAVR